MFRDSWPGSAAPAGRARRGPEARSLDGVLLRAEAASLLRDASTPAQLGSLAAVFLLDLMNVRLLPGTDATARDLVAGLQTGLSLFLVSALSLRFAYPSVSSDGRAALVLRTLPLDPRRQLLVRWAVRALPAAGVALALTGASLLVLRPERTTSALALVAALAGSLAIPALHVGLGALFPRYDAPNAVSVALSSGGLFALVFSTGLSLLSTLVVSDELRLLLGALLKMRLSPWPLLLFFLASAAAAAIAPMALAARSLATARHLHRVTFQEDLLRRVNERRAQGTGCSGGSPRAKRAISSHARRAIARRVSKVAEPRCGRRTTFGRETSPGWICGSRCVDVQTRAQKMLRRKGRDQGGLRPRSGRVPCSRGSLPLSFEGTLSLRIARVSRR